VTLPRKNYPDAATRVAFVERFVDEAGRQLGVRAVGVVTNVPSAATAVKARRT
jgi:hypothetical protein